MGKEHTLYWLLSGISRLSSAEITPYLDKYKKKKLHSCSQKDDETTDKKKASLTPSHMSRQFHGTTYPEWTDVISASSY